MIEHDLNISGREIDAIARRPLWEVGLQYRHGTGHGIGMFLSVHEGKQLYGIMLFKQYIFNIYIYQEIREKSQEIK